MVKSSYGFPTISPSGGANPTVIAPSLLGFIACYKFPPNAITLSLSQ